MLRYSRISNIELHVALCGYAGTSGIFIAMAVGSIYSICWNEPFVGHSAHCTLYATRLTQTLALIRSDGVTDKHARIIFCVQFSCVRLFSPSCRLLVAGPHCHAAFLCIITYLRSTFCYTNQTKFYYSQNHKLKIPTMGYVWWSSVCVCMWVCLMMMYDGLVYVLNGEYISLLNWNLHTSRAATGAQALQRHTFYYYYDWWQPFRLFFSRLFDLCAASAWRIRGDKFDFARLIYMLGATVCAWPWQVAHYISSIFLFSHREGKLLHIYFRFDSIRWMRKICMLLWSNHKFDCNSHSIRAKGLFVFFSLLGDLDFYFYTWMLHHKWHCDAICQRRDLFLFRSSKRPLNSAVSASLQFSTRSVAVLPVVDTLWPIYVRDRLPRICMAFLYIRSHIKYILKSFNV